MKTRKTVTLTVVAALMLLLAGGVGLVLAQGPNLGAALGSTFTYQGQLTDDGNPATGSYDFQFTLFDDPTSGSQVGETLDVEDKEVERGLFTVSLDFGPDVFKGDARYLEIAVRPGDSSGGYTTLAPRQQLTAAPYALHSLSTGALQGHPISNTMPTTGQLLQWNGSSWQPATVAAPNQPPVAVLQAGPAILMPGYTTTLSLDLSYDPEGGPLTYAFDFTGQMMGPPGTYDVTPTTVVSAEDYPLPGDYLAAGWVKDGAARFDVARALVSVYRWWSTIVDSTGSVGQYASLAMVDGRPAIAYYDNTNDDLKYVRALDPTGSSWGTPVTVTTTGDVGQYASLAVVDGNPAIAYRHGTTGLYYVRASDASGSSWGTPVAVDSSGNVDYYASLAVVDGNPAIAYHQDSDPFDFLYYVRATDATGSTWGSPQAVRYESPFSVGDYASLAVVSGRPAIAYRGPSGAEYVRAQDATGSSWGSTVLIPGSGSEEYWVSLAVVDSQPAIASFEPTSPDYDLRYVRASDATGSSWGTPLTLEGVGSVGLDGSLEVVGGRPAIAYYNGTSDDLRYLQATDTTGATWGTPVVVDSDGDVGQYVSLAEVAGLPAVAYYDETNDDLRFAIPRQW